MLRKEMLFDTYLRTPSFSILPAKTDRFQRLPEQFLIAVLYSNQNEIQTALASLESEGFKDISTFNFEIWEKGGGKTSAIVRHSASEAQTHIDTLKDVSNAEDWDVLHVKGTTSVPLIDLINDFGLISEGDVLYCGNGHKSMAAASFLKIKGVNVTDIIGGLSAMLVEAPDLEI